MATQLNLFSVKENMAITVLCCANAQGTLVATAKVLTLSIALAVSSSDTDNMDTSVLLNCHTSHSK